jgi:pimeloyl-ACP methyl ester carboxylesterase
MQSIVQGLLTHYERMGSGPVILVLPGWTDTSSSWLRIQKKLSASFDVIILDIPGFGGSQAPKEAWDLSDYSAFISSFLNKIGVGDLHAVIGHSNGGAMAVRSLGTSRVVADKLVLVASAGIRLTTSRRKKILRAVAKIGKMLAKPLPKSTQNKLRSRLYKVVGSDMLAAEHMQETFKKIVAHDVQMDAARIAVPALLMYGDKDTETPVLFGEKFNSLIPNSRLEIFHGSGHFLHVEQPDKLSADILKFLR